MTECTHCYCEIMRGDDHAHSCPYYGQMPEWTIGLNGTAVFIRSNDFTHDVQMNITGDFSTLSDKVEYARGIVRKLNGN